MRFEKYEGIGNDFVLVESSVTRAEAIRLCDRRKGIGADGVLRVDVGSRAMEVFNSDGSVALMCGNGLRCVAEYLHRRGAPEEFEVQTASGPHSVKVHGQGDVEVWMRAATSNPLEIPLTRAEPAIDFALSEDFGAIKVTAVGVGNPHLVTFSPLGEEARERLAPRLQALDWFPDGANVGFASLQGGRLALSVFERGVGWTQACGTGACAAAAAAVWTGRARAKRPLEVSLPGGSLQITVGDPGERIRMRGPATFVFAGDVER